jgi:iron(III) transport system permease protein
MREAFGNAAPKQAGGGILKGDYLRSGVSWGSTRKGYALWIAFLLSVTFFFFLLPLLRLFALSAFEGGRLDLGLYGKVLSETRIQVGILSTAKIVGVSAVLSVFIGLAEAWLMAYTDVRGKAFLRVFFVLPFVIPSYITSLAWSRFLGPSGFLSQITGWNVPVIYGYWGIVWVMGICHAPLAYMFCLNALRKIPREAEWAARCSGYGPWRTFLRVTMPYAMPGIAGGAMTVVLAGLDNFGIPAFLGGRKGINVLSTLIYQEIVGFGPSAFRRAACLSFVLGVMALACCFVLRRLLRHGETLESLAPDTSPRCFLGGTRWKVETLVWSFVVVTSLLPLFSMVATSLLRAYGLKLSPENLSLKNFVFLLHNPKSLGALRNSGVLAFITGFCALLTGSVAAWGRARHPGFAFRAIEAAFALPFVLPGAVFALATIIAWIEPLPGWRPGIYGTTTLLAITYVVRFSVLQLRATMSALQQVDRSAEEAARVCGAGVWRRWGRILVPLLSPGLLSGFVMTATHALTELTISSILGSPGSETVGMVILNFEQSGNVVVSCAFSTLVLGMLGLLSLFAWGLSSRRSQVKEIREIREIGERAA